jgi:hypothetical protein
MSRRRIVVVVLTALVSAWGVGGAGALGCLDCEEGGGQPEQGGPLRHVSVTTDECRTAAWTVGASPERFDDAARFTSRGVSCEATGSLVLTDHDNRYRAASDGPGGHRSPMGASSDDVVRGTGADGAGFGCSSGDDGSLSGTDPSAACSARWDP